MKSSIDFPELTDDEIAHSEKLIDKIIQKMDGGVMPFSQYMSMALYEPGLGYYTAGSFKIGAAGDFTTAPEISGLFGQCLAYQTIQRIQQGKKANFLEFGAGTGKLCLDIISYLNDQQVNWLSYSILETSADLVERQQHLLSQHLSTSDFKKLHWIHQLPNHFNGIIIGNEVLDAMPVDIVIKQQGWHELGVAFEDGKFTWKECAGESSVAKSMQAIEDDNNLDLPLGYCTEINNHHQAWLKSLSESCDSVDVYLIDYGYYQSEYYHVERTTGTLMCYFRHRGHSDPLILPGLQDITASIDFTAFAEAAELCGFDVLSIETQAEFLIKNNLIEHAEKQISAYQGENLEVHELKTAQQIKTLTLPSEMGETFKVISLTM